MKQYREMKKQKTNKQTNKQTTTTTTTTTTRTTGDYLSSPRMLLKTKIYVQESLAATRFLLPASNLLAASGNNLLHLALRSGLEVDEPNTNQANDRWASNGHTHRRRRLHSIMAPEACHWLCQPNYRTSLKKSKETSAASWGPLSQPHTNGALGRTLER